MIGYILSAVKSFFGLKNDHRTSKKRAIYRLDFDVSDDDDDESEYELVAPKRRKLSGAEIESETGSSSYGMADWIKPMAGFSQNYYYTKIPVAKHEKPKTVVISDDSADECEVIAEKGTKASWNWKSSHNSSQDIEYSRSGRNGKSSRHVKAVHKRKGESSDTFLTQPQYTTLSVAPKAEQKLKNGTDRLMTNGHGHQEKSLSSHCEHVCSVHKTSGGIRKKRGTTAAECFRLEEKERYRQLLQQYSASTNPLYGMYGYNGQSTSKPTPRQMFSNTFKSLQTPEVQVLQDQTPRRSYATRAVMKEKLTETHQQHHTKSILLKEQKGEPRQSLRQQPSPSNLDIEVVETVATRPPIASRRRRSSRQTDSPSLQKDSEQSIKVDDSVVITKEVVVPKWKQTLNSMGGFEYSSPAWLQEWKKTLALEREEKKRQIEAAQENAKTLGKNLETMVNKLHLGTTEPMPEIVEEVFTLDEEQEEEVEPLPELTPEMEERIDDAFCPTPPDELLVEGFRLQIRRRDMETLQDLNWLNDEVINFYMNLLMERGKADNMPSVYAVNTFFYPKLISGGHDALKRWTRKVDVFAHEIMLVPVHLGVHWCLAVVNFKDKTLIYYDSMGGNNNECLNSLREYLQAESLDKKKKSFDMTDWSIKNAKDIPQQMNSSDCGMFACKYAEYITRNAKITFKQEHMPYFRRRMVYEIITKRLL